MSLFFLTAASLLVADADTTRDWGKYLREDATSMHEAIASNHPGPLNQNDPEFTVNNDAGWRLAVERADTAVSFEDYFYAMQAYAASFNDGHLRFGVYGPTPDTIRAWPGFLARYDADDRPYVVRSDEWSGVPMGALLLGCDGRTADEIGHDRIGTRLGRWNLTSQKWLFGGLMFVDTGNPYVSDITRCQFEDGGEVLEVELQWRPPVDFSYDDIFPPILSARSNVEWRQLADGTEWLTLPSFDGNPDGVVGTALRNLLAEMDGSTARLNAAPAIVLDLRGNGGGSSDWAWKVAERLWGEEAFVQNPEPPMTVTWRASQENLNAIQESFDDRSSSGNMAPEVNDWYQESIAGLKGAIEQGEETWQIFPEPVAVEHRAEALPPHPRPRPIYVLTDPICMSACLDAVDLWMRLGAVPIGQETGADTVYMETRQVRLPSGLGSLTLPMKMYAGRPRGSNQPVSPRHRFSGDIMDTQAVEGWVVGLPEKAGIQANE